MRTNVHCTCIHSTMFTCVYVVIQPISCCCCCLAKLQSMCSYLHIHFHTFSGFYFSVAQRQNKANLKREEPKKKTQKNLSGKTNDTHTQNSPNITRTSINNRTQSIYSYRYLWNERFLCILCSAEKREQVLSITVSMYQLNTNGISLCLSLGFSFFFYLKPMLSTAIAPKPVSVSASTRTTTTTTLTRIITAA